MIGSGYEATISFGSDSVSFGNVSGRVGVVSDIA